ncbi:hypothetical protein HK101_004256 [Irineochytrium annulatum]|nr:hypothetical protein HK101_004256 [Irineochytrium annulatum]
MPPRPPPAEGGVDAATASASPDFLLGLSVGVAALIALQIAVKYLGRIKYDSLTNYMPLNDEETGYKDEENREEVDPGTPMPERKASLKPIVPELPAVRQCRLAVRAILVLTENSPESVAYTSLFGGDFFHAASTTNTLRPGVAAPSDCVPSNDLPPALAATPSLDVSSSRQQQFFDETTPLFADKPNYSQPALSSESPSTSTATPSKLPRRIASRSVTRAATLPATLPYERRSSGEPKPKPLLHFAKETFLDSAELMTPSAAFDRDQTPAIVRSESPTEVVTPLVQRRRSGLSEVVDFQSSQSASEDSGTDKSSPKLQESNFFSSANRRKRNFGSGTYQNLANLGSGLWGGGSGHLEDEALNARPRSTDSNHFAALFPFSQTFGNSSPTMGVAPAVRPLLDKVHFSAEHPYEWAIPGFGRLKCVDFAPLAFKSIRERFGYSAKDLQDALTGPCAVELTVGKSDAVFFKTEDNRFLFKTLRGAEPENLRQFLPEYLTYVANNPDTFLPRYVGLYYFEMPSRPNGSSADESILNVLSKPFTVVVMANVFDTDLEIQQKYDFKGSTVGRQTLADAARGDTSSSVPLNLKQIIMASRSSLDAMPNRSDAHDMSSTKPGRPRPSSSGGFTPGPITDFMANGGVKAEGSSSTFQAFGTADGGGPSEANYDLTELTLKELDFEKLLKAGRSNRLHLGPKKEVFMKQIQSDLELLKKYGFMDYSVLVGIHRKKKPPPPPTPAPPVVKTPSYTPFMSFGAQRPTSIMVLFGSGQQPAQQSAPLRSPPASETMTRSTSSRSYLQRPSSSGPISPTAHSYVDPPTMDRAAAASRSSVLSARDTILSISSANGRRAVVAALTNSAMATLSRLVPKQIVKVANGVLSGGEGYGGDDEDSSSVSIRIPTPGGHYVYDDEEDDDSASELSGSPDALGQPSTPRFSTGPMTGLHSGRFSDEETDEERSESDEDVEEEKPAARPSDPFDESLHPDLPFGKRYRGGIRSEGLLSEETDFEVYFVGIIDVLQKFNTFKWIERSIHKQKQILMTRPTSPPFVPFNGHASSSSSIFHQSLDRGETLTINIDAAMSPASPTDPPLSLAALFKVPSSSEAGSGTSTPTLTVRTSSPVDSACMRSPMVSPTSQPTPASVMHPTLGGSGIFEPLSERSRMEISVEEPVRYASRLLNYLDRIIV